MTEVDELFKEAMQATPVSELLPFTFNKGTSRIDTINCDCGNCGQVVTPDNIRGETSSLNEHTIAFTGYAICYKCMTLTAVSVRFADDGTFLTRTENGWKRNRITLAEDPGLVVIAWRYLRSLAVRLRG